MNRDNFKWTDELVKDFFLDYRKKISSYPISQRIAEFKASHTSAIEDENDEYEGVSSKELKHIIRFWKKSNQSNYENWKEANYELRKLKNQISPASSAIEEREGDSPQNTNRYYNRRLDYLEDKVAYIEKKLNIEG